MIYNKESLEVYVTAGLATRLIPLHRWDYIDARGTERGKSPRDARWRDTSYTLEDIHKRKQT